MGDDTNHILIVGSGFAGLGIAIKLLQAGVSDFTVLERARTVGGTWRDNTYPGLACDVPSHLYSYSFEPHPGWSRLFAPQAEILAYLEHCADKYGVRPRIRFDTTVESATFDEAVGTWTVRTGAGETLRARVLVSAAGHALTSPVYPEIEGRETFEGRAIHSARWDHDYPLEGQVVAVVGTGASAVQIIPAIAPRVRRMHVFQRTPSWVLPKPDRPMALIERQLLRHVPGLQTLTRAALYCLLESLAVGYVVNPRLNVLRERHARRFLRQCVRDPALREKLTPAFRLGCKRILLTNDFYETLQREHVELVTAPITAIRRRSIVTGDGFERAVDAIIYATGYEAADARPPFVIQGVGRRTLGSAWQEGSGAYLGTTTAGFPNLFLLLGPNLGLGHNSMVLMMESQFSYIVDAIRTLRARRARCLDVRADAQARYNDWLQKRLARTVWNTGGCRSWYLSRSGRNTTAWPGFTFEFWARTRRFDPDRYTFTA